MQTRLKPILESRVREDYPQINYTDSKGIQHIELNRGCPYQCVYCWSDPNFKEFPIPEIVSNKVQIIGEAFLSDSRIHKIIESLGKIKVNKKVVYYGLSQGLNKKDLTHKLIDLISTYRFGLITNKGSWKKGIRISWDLGIGEGFKVKEIINALYFYGYRQKNNMVFILTNYKITLDECLYKLRKLKEWKVMVDDCTFNCTKTNFIPIYWSFKEHKVFRKQCRDHNLEILGLKR